MNSTPPTTIAAPATLAEAFFRQSEGKWRSQRRYYTLETFGDEEPQEVVSTIEIEFLDADDPQLAQLAKRHDLAESNPFNGGARVSWESHYTASKRKPAKGSTVFGIGDNLLYRDRGFATAKPVTAEYRFSDPNTMCLRTEYNGSVFEEELKLIGSDYRTRQTIITQAGRKQTIGQYLEKRIHD